MPQLYFIAGGGCTKIGVSNDPGKRLRGIQAGNPAVLRITYQCDADYLLERQVWQHLTDRGHTLIRGEWFRGEIGSDEAERIVTEARGIPEALSAAEARDREGDWPTCSCHGLPMYWAKSARHRGGGYWRCSV